MINVTLLLELKFNICREIASVFGADLCCCEIMDHTSYGWYLRDNIIYFFDDDMEDPYDSGQIEEIYEDPEADYQLQLYDMVIKEDIFLYDHYSGFYSLDGSEFVIFDNNKRIN